MAENSESMWPEEIRPSVQSPYSILATQADALTKQTGGVLVGKVTGGGTENNLVLLSLSMVVPTLGDFTQHIMTVRHKAGMPYPAVVDAELFRALDPVGLAAAIQSIQSMQVELTGRSAPLDPEEQRPANRADSDKELMEMVRKVIRSRYIVSVAQSLISRAEDRMARGERAAAGSQVEKDALESGSDAR
jgi:hypothetical protein